MYQNSCFESQQNQKNEKMKPFQEWQKVKKNPRETKFLLYFNGVSQTKNLLLKQIASWRFFYPHKI
jgi:hypothetical protein